MKKYQFTLNTDSYICHSCSNVWKWQVNCIHQEKTMLLRTVFSYFMQRFWFLLESAVLFPEQAVINW